MTSVPVVAVPVDAYERMRILAFNLDAELNAVRQIVVEHTGSKRSMGRDLLTVLARADYWYDMWKTGRGVYDERPWRGHVDRSGLWEPRP